MPPRARRGVGATGVERERAVNRDALPLLGMLVLIGLAIGGMWLSEWRDRR